MVGEIRDTETAQIAIQASLTGHLVLSTLHTNDAPGAVTRLIDMGVEPFLVASSLVMLSAQRLCRKICLKCRQPQEVSKEFLEKIGFKEKANFYVAKGCKYCNNTGYYGRIAILEAILIDDTIREMIIKKVSIDEIKKYAIEKCGMHTLRDDAFLKVKEELTTLDEAIRITTEE
ncbi:MAG: Flp pilus assembly complex ATPase component TadA, partial [Candidatus Omnitrophica bacterium]|nr:Flp pilus assembly complex ATPase component TadA [Candidatus Omnitrophota bacterium]